MDDELPQIAVIGAGPLGLEAALYARYLGYPTQVFELSDKAATKILVLGEQTLGAFGGLTSRLGVSALRAQYADWQPPTNAPLTARQWHEKYLTPLAESDLISDVLHLGHKVIGITRRDADDDVSFELRCRDAQGAEVVNSADIVIDATGAKSPAWFGDYVVDPELGFANPEADFYVLGAKGGAETFAAGLVQIRDLFAILGEREDLDVYATMPEIDMTSEF
jgi:cation diffusion facilitator CzcD-associated flavoprotein CzcO